MNDEVPEEVPEMEPTSDPQHTSDPELAPEADLTPGEEAKLRSLLSRAGAGLTVQTPNPAPPDVLAARDDRATLGAVDVPAGARPSVPAGGRVRHPGRWIGVAAAILVVGVVGAMWSRSGDTDTQLAATATTTDASRGGQAESGSSGNQDMVKSEGATPTAPGSGLRNPETLTGGPDTSISVDPKALAAGGIWRLPDGSDSLEVIGVETSKRTSGFQIAVDDVDDPTRWFAILPTKYWMNVGGQVQPADSYDLGNSMTATVLRPDPATSPTGSAWIDLEQAGDNLNALTFVYKGVSEDEALSIVKDIAASISSLNDADAVRSALLAIRLPSGLVPTWDPMRVGYPSDDDATIESVNLTLRNRESSEKYIVTLTYSGLGPAVARLEQLFGLEASLLNSPVGSGPIDVVISPGVLTLSYQGIDLLMAFTDDGVEMSAERSSHKNLTIDQQRQILDTLRPVSESEFRRRLQAQEIPIN